MGSEPDIIEANADEGRPDVAEGGLRWWVKTLAIPLALCVVPVLFETFSHQRVERENQFRLYTELLSKREEADMNVRQAIFAKVFDKYLPPDSKDIETRLVGLELMSTNFHESVDIGPLFWQLDRQIMKTGDPRTRAENLKELARIASVVKDRQIEGLEIAGSKQEVMFDLDLADADQKDVSFDLSLPKTAHSYSAASPTSRHFTVALLKSDVQNRKLQVQLTYSNGDKDRFIVIWCDLYDFPMMAFSRLSDDERVALVLTGLDADAHGAQITVVYYPSSRSGTQDKPFIDEVLSRLGR